MKLQTNADDAVVTGGSGQGQFEIKASPKAFQILSSGLYSDKILAIVRELSCNAYDSHTEAGNDEPFVVQLPNSLNPEFRIRDYGIGLDNEGVTQVYTTYFESTKQDSNDYIGALGLGSKSPFSYTKNFSITAWKDGVQRSYAAFIDGDGFPNFVLLDEVDTDEPNGVEVKFAVERNDFYKFADAAKKVFKWFDRQPTIKGEQIKIEPQQMKHVQIVPGVDVREGYQETPYARQGVVVYPLKPNADVIDEDLRPLLKVPFVIDFPVGSLDVAASREELSYIDHTNKSINDRLREIADGLSDYVKAQLKGAKTDWDKVLVIENMKDNMFKSIMKTILQAPNLFKTIEVDSGDYGTPRVIVDTTKINASQYMTKTRNHSTGEIRLSLSQPSPVYSAPDPKTGEKTVVAQVLKVYAPKATIFLNDTGKRNVLGRVRLYCKNNDHGQHVYVVRADDAKALKAAKAALGNAPMIKCSTLDEPARYGTKVGSTTRISLLQLKPRGNNSRSYYTANDTWMWDSLVTSVADACKDDKGKNQETLYVPLKNRIVLTPNGQEWNKDDFYGFMDNIVSAGLWDADIGVLGVRKSVIDELTSDYVNLFDWVKKKIAALSVQKMAANVKRKALADKAIFSESQLLTMSDELGPKHIVAEISGLVADAKTISGLEHPSRVLYLSRTASSLDVKFDVDGAQRKGKDAANDLWNKFVGVYPMLEFVHEPASNSTGRREVTAIIDYIKMVDEAA